MSDEQGLWAPLKYRDFRLLWGGFIVSHVGDSIQMHAQAWLVTELTRSGFKVGLVALAQSLPRLILGLFAGVIVDRVDRRRMLVVTQALAMVQAVTFLSLVHTHRITYEWILILAVSLGVFDTLNLNARIAMMPTLVPRPLIGKAVALQALGINVVQIMGPATTALLIGGLGIEGCLAANAATFVILLVVLAVVHPPPSGGGVSTGFGNEMREGFEFVRARPLLWGSIVLAYLLGFFGVSVARLLALYARVVLETDASRYGLLAAATGVGALVASIVVTARARPSQLPRNIVVAAFVFSGSLAVLAISHRFVSAFAALIVLGFGQMAFRSAITTSIQLETPDRLRGRVISLLTLDFSFWSIGAMVVGLVTDRLALMHAPLMPGFVPGTTDPARLSHPALAWGLAVTLGLMAAICVACTLALSRTILRARLTTAADKA